MDILQSKKLPSFFEVWSGENKANLNNPLKMEIRLEDSTTSQQVTVQELKAEQ